MNLSLKIWRQDGPTAKGHLQTIEAKGISPDLSFLEMLDVVNERLIEAGERPVAFDHDCREGICGSCGMMINGVPHGPKSGTTTCQLHMRHFNHGDTILIEPFRSRAFPIVRDLVVDRSSLDRLVAAGGFITAPTGAAPDGNAIPISKPHADAAMDAATCIGCGACVAACPNASAMLFVGAKISHLGRLPQGQPERWSRVEKIVQAMDAEGFGGCTNITECEAACPKSISVEFIARLNRDRIGAVFFTSKTRARSSESG